MSEEQVKVENQENEVQVTQAAEAAPEVKVEEEPVVQKEEKKKIRPKIFRSKDEKIDIHVYGYYNGTTGELEFVLPESNEENEESDILIIQKHVFTFSNIPYNRLNIYKDRARQYNKVEKVMTVDMLKFNDFIWTFHLKDWNLEDENGNKVEITHDQDGTLSNDSEEKLWQVPAVILDTVIQLLEEKLNIVL